MRLMLPLLLSVGLGLAGLYLATREEIFSAALYAPKGTTRLANCLRRSYPGGAVAGAGR